MEQRAAVVRRRAGAPARDLSPIPERDETAELAEALLVSDDAVVHPDLSAFTVVRIADKQR